MHVVQVFVANLLNLFDAAYLFDSVGCQLVHQGVLECNLLLLLTYLVIETHLLYVQRVDLLPEQLGAEVVFAVLESSAAPTLTSIEIVGATLSRYLCHLGAIGVFFGSDSKIKVLTLLFIAHPHDVVDGELCRVVPLHLCHLVVLF